MYRKESGGMMVIIDRRVYINGYCFIDVTNQTATGPIYTIQEAKELTQGRCVDSSYGWNGKQDKKKK